MKRILGVLIVGILSGCATQRMPVEQYTAFANTWVSLERCKVAGGLSSEQVALGKYQYNQLLNTYSYDQSLLRSEIESLSRYPQQTGASCSEVAEWITTNRIREQTGQGSTMYMPTFTNCSTYFGQTHCTTY